jgi:amidase
MSTLADQTRWMDATDQAALVANGEVSPSELLEAAIERIERISRRAISHQGSLRHLRGAADQQWQRRAQGARVIADADTTLVSRYRAAGLVTAGPTNSPELGSVPTTEPCRMNWRPQ